VGQGLNILHGRPDEAAIDDGELPAGPLDELLGLRTLEVEEGRVVVGLMPSHAHCSATGSVHGAVPAALLESAAACALQTILPAGARYRTMDLAISVVRLIDADTRLLYCDSQVVDRTSEIATVEGRVWADPGQRLVAHGKVTCIIDSQ
jgi:uncharacterized protein (TIGR00369 family)